MSPRAGSDPIAAAQGGLLRSGGLWARISSAWTGLSRAAGLAFAAEVEERRPFLWLPVAAGGGVVAYFAAAREPAAVAAPFLLLLCAALAHALRDRRAARFAALALCAAAAGFCSAQWRTARVAAPAIARIQVAELTGYVEEMDLRRQGARFLLRVASIDGAGPMPFRVRLTLRQTPDFSAGSFVALRARLLPPARAVLPGGYDFSRDAFFARIGAVGSVLGRVETLPPPDPPDLAMALMMQVDRARNALAARVDEVVGGDAGAIAAAMVTGKRDRLSEGTRELIREAGIFHIITISGIQMTLVAGILFWLVRRGLALSRTLALGYPIKKWAAAAAILGALVYDIGTGSRVGTERALFMTMIVFVAVLCDRQAFTMRNLALAALVVIALEPEAILGASFQLSFAAVAALVAVYEARMRASAREREPQKPPQGGREPSRGAAAVEWLGARTRRGAGAMLFATLCATSATASFMAYHFHEISPYVLIGNPLTLGIIEFFAVPGALLGTALYPLGLDAPVWHYVGLGIELVLWAARRIASAPGASLHVGAFAPWAIGFLALAVLCAVIWQSFLLRLTALPLLAIGLMGAASGERFDISIPPSGDAAAVRLPGGAIGMLGRRPNPFASEQWLRADGDGRPARDVPAGRCDALGCAAALAGGGTIALVLAKEAFEEDCARAAIVVTPLFAPPGCAAPHVVDRRALERGGAIALVRGKDGGYARRQARPVGEDRPWSPASRFAAAPPRGPATPPGAAPAPDEPPDPGFN